MSTFPLNSNVAVWPNRATVMLPVAAKVPAAGSYISAPAIAIGAPPLPPPSPLLLSPPAMSTFPLNSNVAVWNALATVMLPVAVKVPNAGSYSSALASDRETPTPPAMRTLPFGSNVAVWANRATVTLPVLKKAPCTVVPVMPA